VSAQATELLTTIAERYAAAGSPDHTGWCFDGGVVTDAHRELEASGVLQRVFGVPGGFGWRLTDAGAQQARACA
jgi:hypothetical protein